MDAMAFPLENLQPLTTIGVLTVASSRWTWMALVLVALLSLWGLKGVKGFSFAFPWWGKHAQVRVILQSFSSLPSCVSNCSTAKKNNTVFADDNLMICENMWKDDLHLPKYRGEIPNERGIYARIPKKRSKSCPTIDGLGFWCSEEGAGSGCFLHAKMVFTIEKPSALSVAKSVPRSVSPLRFAEKKLGSPTSDLKKDCLPPSLIRLPKHNQLNKTDEFQRNEYKSIEELQERRGKITFSSDVIYDMEFKEKCKGTVFSISDGEGRGGQLEPCLFDNCVDLDLWRRVESFEIQFGWDRLQSLRLGYDWNWNSYTGRFGLTLDKYSKYLVRDINFANVLDSPKRSLVKLFSIHEDVVSSVEVAWNVGLSSTCTVSENSTVRLWDIEVGKCLNKMVVHDYAIVGSHIENSSGLLLSTIMTKEETGSLFVWDPRDFSNPLNFSMGNFSTFHSVQLSDSNELCFSDCFKDMLFDLRMIGASPVEVISPAKLSSMPKENTNSVEDFIFFSHDDEKDEDDTAFYDSGDPGIADSENSCRPCFVEKLVGALPSWCTFISWL